MFYFSCPIVTPIPPWGWVGGLVHNKPVSVSLPPSLPPGIIRTNLSVSTEQFKERVARIRHVRGGNSLVLTVNVEVKVTFVVHQHTQSAVDRQFVQLLGYL